MEPELVQIKYHKSCYTRYKRSSERHLQKETLAKREAMNASPPMSPVIREKRAKTNVTLNPQDNPCIVCNQIKCQVGPVRSLVQGIC